MTGIDVVVAGGGLAGGAAAIRLAESGASVTLVERTRGPHDKVCGEFLSGETIQLLAAVGIDVAALGAVPILSLGVPRGRSTVSLGLPFSAASLSRRVLDEAVLRAAQARGVHVLRGVAVRSFQTVADGFRVDLDGARALECRDLVVATGKHDLKGHGRATGDQPGLVGMKIHLRPAADAPSPLPARTDLLGLSGGYAGLQPIEGGLLNLCLLVPRKVVARERGFEPLLRAIIGGNLSAAPLLFGAEPAMPRPVAIYPIPYGYVRRAGASVRFVGDQAAVIPSFTGDGMAIALWTGLQAAESIVAGEPAMFFQPRIAAGLSAQVARATRLSRFLVRPWFQSLAAAAVSVAPALARGIARSTRLAEPASVG